MKGNAHDFPNFYDLCILLMNQKLNADVTRGYIVCLTVTTLLLK